MQRNRKTSAVYTHEGARASRVSALEELRRSVMANLLWEGSFYEDGEDVADRIKSLVPQCLPDDVAGLAIEAREQMRLRHVPLLLVRELARHADRCPDGLIRITLERVIKRADEMAEFVSLYWADGKQPLSMQVKKGLAAAFTKFDEYQLAKYNRDRAIKMRDVMFLVHPKPKDQKQAAVFKRLANDELATPDTWEVALSGGADKRETFERLLSENKLGYMALLRNLRNMVQTGVDQSLIKSRLLDGAARSKALPFRFISAARSVPSLEPVLDNAMQMAMQEMPTLAGDTVIVIDVSGSMCWSKVSRRSDMTRMDAAAALAVLGVGLCENVRVLTFSNIVVEVPPRKGMALVDAVIQSQPHGGTRMGSGVAAAKALKPDRIIVFTDEQSHDRVPEPGCRGYIINVATYQHGVGYGPWTHINGFSESVMRYIQAYEG